MKNVAPDSNGKTEVTNNKENKNKNKNNNNTTFLSTKADIDEDIALTPSAQKKAYQKQMRNITQKLKDIDLLETKLQQVIKI